MEQCTLGDNVECKINYRFQKRRCHQSTQLSPVLNSALASIFSVESDISNKEFELIHIQV